MKIERPINLKVIRANYGDNNFWDEVYGVFHDLTRREKNLVDREYSKCEGNYLAFTYLKDKYKITYKDRSAVKENNVFQLHFNCEREDKFESENGGIDDLFYHWDKDVYSTAERKNVQLSVIRGAIGAFNYTEERKNNNPKNNFAVIGEAKDYLKFFRRFHKSGFARSNLAVMQIFDMARIDYSNLKNWDAVLAKAFKRKQPIRCPHCEGSGEIYG